MKDVKALLVVRNTMKAKKPHFLRQDAHKIQRLKDKWRQPRGIHSQMRVHMKGHRRHPAIGFSSPPAVRGLTHDGFKIISVHTLQDLSLVKDKTKEAVLLASSIGMKKRLPLLKKARELHLKVLNYKNLDTVIKLMEDSFTLRKELVKKKEQKKKQVKEEIKKKEEKKDVKEETAEEKEKSEKEEKRKVLEKGL